MVIKKNSLAARHFLSSAVLLPILLGIIALGLDKAFVSSQLSDEQSALQTQIYLLIGAAEPTDHSLALPDELTEPRYSLPSSGLYAAVQSKQDIVWRSKSLLLNPEIPSQIPAKAQKTGQEQFGEARIGNGDYFYFFLDTEWTIDDEDLHFRFMAIHTREEFNREIGAYRKTLWWWLGALAITLIAAQFLLIRWGLAPLKTLADELIRFQEGETRHLEGNYPAEISPVTENLNAVLESEKKQRERYRNTLSDLAHSLKTPLAIVRGEISAIDMQLRDSKSTQQINQQVSRMADIINHQLKRATLKRTHALKNVIDIRAVCLRLADALEKVYAEKGVDFKCTIPDGVTFIGEESDAMELFGNLIENAFKYCNKQVVVDAEVKQDYFETYIEDDGPGVPGHLTTEILQRGARGDTTAPGQGIGLAIAVDIISSYSGGINVDRALLGGARFTISLPSAKFQSKNSRNLT